MIIETTSNPKVVEYIVIWDGHRTHLVPKQFYEHVRHLVLAFLPQMVPEQGYKSEAMCGADFWRPLTAEEQRMAGRCIADMVRNALLPLRRLGCRHQYSARYALR